MSGEGGGVSQKKEEAEQDAQDACLVVYFRVQSALFEEAWCKYGDYGWLTMLKSIRLYGTGYV